MLNLAVSNTIITLKKEEKTLAETKKNIARLEEKIRCSHGIGSIKIRASGKIHQLIYKNIDFIEFDKQWWPQMSHNLIDQRFQLSFNVSPPISKSRSIYSEGKGFLYCTYLYSNSNNEKKLTLVEKHPILNASKRSQSNIIKTLNKLKKILSCSKELDNISRLLKLYWKLDIKV
jgi:hypothetical protein